MNGILFLFLYISIPITIALFCVCFVNYTKIDTKEIHLSSSQIEYIVREINKNNNYGAISNV